MRWLDVVGSSPSFEGLFSNFFWLGQIGQVCGQKSHLGPTGGSRATQIDIHLGVVRLVTRWILGRWVVLATKSRVWCSIHKLSSVPSVNPDAYPLQR